MDSLMISFGEIAAMKFPAFVNRKVVRMDCYKRFL